MSLRKALVKYMAVLTLLLGVASGPSYAGVPVNPDENFVIASVMIASPGDELYSKLGHAFLRMQCPSHKMDFCFTYESEDAAQKVFSFLSGTLKMGMQGIPTKEFLKHYAEEGRRVSQYTLNLPVSVKQNMWRILDRYVAEGMELPYDYMERGCAYSVYRVIREAGEDRHFTFGIWPDDFSLTRREIVCSQLDDAPWTRLFLNIITNGPIDDEVSYDEKVITPKSLIQVLEITKVDGKPLVGENPVEILPLKSQKEGGAPVTPLLVAFVLFIVTLTCGLMMKNSIMLPLVILQSVLGVFVSYLIFLSTLCATEWSWLIIPYNPLPLVFWKWRRFWELPYSILLAGWCFVIYFGGSYLMDPSLILFALTLSLSYFFDFIIRKGLTIPTFQHKLTNLKPI